MKLVAVALCLMFGAFSLAENKGVTDKKNPDGSWKTPNVEVEPEDGVRWGLKAGVNLANGKFGDNMATGTRTAAAGGVVLEFPVMGDFKLQAEGGYAEYGYTVTGSGITGTVSYDVVDAQLLAKWRLGGVESLIKPFVLGGVQVGYRLSSKLKYLTVTEDQSAATKKFMASAVLGGGILLNMGGMDVGVEARYLVGLNDVAQQPPTIKNNTIYVGATLFF